MGRGGSFAEPNALGKVIEGRFSARLCYARSYSQLERITGVSREAISRYVTTRADRYREPPLSTLARFATALEWPLSEFVEAVLVDVAAAHHAPVEVGELTYAPGA